MNAPINFRTKRFKICFSISSLMHIVFGVIIFLNFKQNPEIASAHNNEEATLQKTEKIHHSKQPKNIKPLTTRKPRIANVIIHKVEPGESFWKIANKYTIEIESILKINGLDADYILKVGEKIKIPVGAHQ